MSTLSETGPTPQPGARGKRLLFGLFAPEPLKRLAGKPVRLRFMMRDADLYSLQFK